MASILKFVLVRWTSGDDKDKLSIVDLDAVRGISDVEFDGSGKPSEDLHPVVVEWRAGKKDSRTNAWPFYYAELIQASRM